jgi:Leucine-rich repeat (LRR) protein
VSVQLKNPIAKLRRFLGWFFLLVGVGLVTYVSTVAGRQERVCKEEFGECVWGRMEPKLYFKNGLLADSTCGFGVDKNPNEDVWELDVGGCELEELGEWREAFADLEVLDLRDNELAELPGWLGGGRMGKLRELRASNNTLKNFTFVNWRESVGGVNSTALEVVDLRNNEIAELPYDVMDVEGEGLRLLFDGNSCAEEVDWSGLGKDRLPARMGVGYDNGNFSSSLRVLKLGRNKLDESVFEELVAASFVNITDLDVSWNALGGIEEEVRGQEKLRRLDVSGNSRVGAR